MLERLRKLLGERQPDPPRPTRAPRSRPEPAAAEAAPDSAGAEGADPFAPIAEALGLVLPPPPPPLEPAEEDLVQHLAERILRCASASDLGPAAAPVMSLRILDLVSSPDADVTELRRMIISDPGLSAGVLNVANSPAYRGVDPIESVRDAVTRLGLQEVGRIAGAVAAQSLFNPRLQAGQQALKPRFDEQYARALTVATAAAGLAIRSRRPARPDRVYLGGLLHDLGRTVGLRAVAELILEGQLPVPAFHPLLEPALDRVHVPLGVAAYRSLGLPDFLTVMAEHHHDPTLGFDDALVDLHIVRLVAALDELRLTPTRGHRAALEVVQSARALWLEPAAVRVLATEVRLAAEKALDALRQEGAPVLR
jgi:HD-like signal output (HDOD) protein